MNKVKLKFHLEDCVHIYYRDSSCKRCIEVCPVDGALIQDDYKILVDNEKCRLCGACIGVCPSEAFSIAGFDPYELYKKITSQKKSFLSCKTDLPCISALDVEYLISIVLNNKENLILDVGYCNECEIGSVLDEIKRKTEEANYVLESLGVENRVITQNLKIQTKENREKDRREFLKNFGRAAAGLTFWAMMPSIPQTEEKEERIKNIVQEKIDIRKREVLLKSISENVQDIEGKSLDVNRISFTSDKWIDNKKCTNCSVCYNICPTGALKAGDERLKILFEPKLCIKCKVCHEVCSEDCLHLEDKISIKAFLHETKVLAQHVMIPCEECMIPFSYKGDSTLCPRCRQLDEEIRDLLQIGD